MGAIEAPINTAYKGEWLRHAIDNTEAKVVMVFPPVYAEVNAAMTAENRTTLSQCRAAARKIADRPNVTVLNFRRDGPLTRKISNFRDGIHYRKPVAHLLELAISDVIDGRPMRAEVVEAFGADPEKP